MTKLEQQHLTVQVPFKARYDNFIGGKWLAPVNGRYFENVKPVTGQPFCEVARSDKDDVELALDAAHAAKKAWGRTSTTSSTGSTANTTRSTVAARSPQTSPTASQLSASAGS